MSKNRPRYKFYCLRNPLSQTAVLLSILTESYSPSVREQSGHRSFQRALDSEMSILNKTEIAPIKKVVNFIDNLPKIVLKPDIHTNQFLDDLKRLAALHED